MATTQHDFSYTGTVTPTATTFLECKPLELAFKATLELEASDAAHVKKIQTEFQSEMKTKVKKQVAALNEFLVAKNELLTTMVKHAEQLQSGPIPSNASKAAEYAKNEKEVREIVNKIEDWKKDFQVIVSNFAQNCSDTQGPLALKAAVKSARVKTFDEKGIRVKAGLAVKGVLVVIGVAASIAAIVLTAGATAPIFLGLAAAGLALSGISSLGAVAKSIAENANTEKKLLINVTKDVEAIQAAFGGVKDTGSRLAKHVTELQNLMKMREDIISKLESDLKRYQVEHKSYRDGLKALNSGALVNAKELKAKEKAILEVGTTLDAMYSKIGDLKKDNQDARALLLGLTDLGLQLDKVSGVAPNTVLGNLKGRYKGLDGFLELTGQVGSLTSSAAGIQAG